MSDVTTMKTGSKSFYLASLFFSDELRAGASNLYEWCRYCDDAVDVHGIDVKELELSTKAVWENKNVVGPFKSLQEIVFKHNIPKEYPLDLLQGMRLDTEKRRFNTLHELELYCYYVASTVGLMMCHMMGLLREAALNEAVALGKAMQMTNIARDVKEDFENDRIYLPLEWIAEKGIGPANLLEDREKLFTVVKKLIEESEKLYLEGRRGIKDLPFSAAVAVCLASLYYREIGRVILRTGPDALDKRVVVPVWKKIILTVQGLLEMIFTIPGRVMARKTKTKIVRVWRPV